MAKFVKRPIEIEAFVLGDEWPDWWANAVADNVVTTHNNNSRWRDGPDYAIIATLEGDHKASRGDWIIKGIQGEIYPCKPDIFNLTYEAV